MEKECCFEDSRRSYYCQRLEEYARARQRILLFYLRGAEPAFEVKVNPLGIICYWELDNWYLVAQENDPDHTIKTYAVDRILVVEELGEIFSYPADFVLEDWYKYSWGVYCSGNPVKVAIRFHNYYSTIQRAREELADRETCVLRADGDDLIMEDTVDGLAELAVWLRSFGPGAEVMEPLELRSLVVIDLEQMLAIYGG